MKELIYLLLSKQKKLKDRFFAMKWVEKIKYAVGLDFRNQPLTTATVAAKPARYFRNIAKNIRKSDKDSRGLRADATKVVLEKNFALNCLNKIGGYHLWTGLDDEGNTLIGKPDEYGRFESFSRVGSIIFFAIVVAVFLFMILLLTAPGRGGDESLAWVMRTCWGWFLLTPVVSFVGNLYGYSRWKKNRQKWLRAMSTDRVVIRKDPATYLGALDVQLTFKHKTAIPEVNRWYHSLAGHVTRLAEELDGEAAMLWHYYDEEELSPGHNLRNELGTVDFDVDKATIDISNEPERAVFIPCVVTKHSIVFYFPKMSTGDFYERYFREDRQDLNARLDELLEKQGEGLFCAKEEDEEA